MHSNCCIVKFKNKNTTFLTIFYSFSFVQSLQIKSKNSNIICGDNLYLMLRFPIIQKDDYDFLHEELLSIARWTDARCILPSARTNLSGTNLEQIFLEQKYQLNAQSAQITISSTLSSQSQRQYSQKGDYNLLQTVLMLVGR